MISPLSTFAQISPTELGSLLTILGGMLGGFYVILKIILNQAAEDRKSDREERTALVEAINTMAASTDKVAEATQRAADEAKQRNGHLADISNQNKEAILQAVTNIKEQKVEHQTVHSETVEHETIINRGEQSDGSTTTKY